MSTCIWSKCVCYVFLIFGFALFTTLVCGKKFLTCCPNRGPQAVERDNARTQGVQIAALFLLSKKIRNILFWLIIILPTLVLAFTLIQITVVLFKVRLYIKWKMRRCSFHTHIWTAACHNNLWNIITSLWCCLYEEKRRFGSICSVQLCNLTLLSDDFQM